MAAPYETCQWDSADLRSSLSALDDLAATEPWAGGVAGTLLQGLREEAQRPGPLHVRFATCALPGSAPPLIAQAFRLVHAVRPGLSAEQIATGLNALCRWPFGLYPIVHALDKLVLPESAGRLLGADVPWGPCAVEALWLAGSLSLAERHAASERARSLLMKVGDERCQPQEVRDALSNAASAEFEALEAELLGNRVAGALPGTPHHWYNALLMGLCHCRPPEGRPLVFRALLRYAAAGGRWPLPCRCNEEFRLHCQRLGVPEGFWDTHEFVLPQTPLGPLTLGFAEDPLEILNLGNVFDSCLQSWRHADSYRRLLGWATNANVRVAVARAIDGRALGRQLVGLALQDGEGLVSLCPAYPRADPVLGPALKCFVEDFAASANIDIEPCALVQETCAPFYDEFIIREKY
jgi:hypothetical protein